MEVLVLTVFLSLLLALSFIWMFARERARRRYSSPERESLLPLAEEGSRPAEPSRPRPPGARL